jgi:quercetin dioxygenase-like cupin family protein
MKELLILSFLLLESFFVFAQKYQCKDIKPNKDFENIMVEKIFEDSLQSTFVIWIKKNVPKHYHEYHTEYIQVLRGKALMLIGDEKRTIKKGDFIIIPQKTVHAVLKIKRGPLKVVSVQSPKFDGERIFVED